MTTSYRNARADAWAEMQSLMKLAEGRLLSAAEQQRFDEFERVIRSATSHESYDELAGEIGSGRIQTVPTETTRPTPRDGIRLLKPEERFASAVQPDSYPSDGVTIRGLLSAALSGDWAGIPPEARAMAVGVGSGGFAVPTPLSARLIDKARNAARVIAAGAATVPMDNSTLKFARLATDPTAAWKLENAAAATSDPALEQVTLTAKTLVAFVKMSVELVEDSDPAVTNVVENAMAQAIALEIDRAALRGSGVNPEPLGIRNTTGVSVTSLGANGAAPTYAALSTAIQQVQSTNFEPTAIIYSPRTAGTLDRLVDSTGQPLQPPPSVEGIRKLVTGQIPGNLTQGTSSLASEVYVGQWDQLVIGMRQQLVIEASREASDATDSAFRQLMVFVRAYVRMDVAVAQPGAFAVVSGVL